jgi:hypothetical protein
MAKTNLNPFTQNIISPQCMLWKNIGASAITGADGAVPTVSNTVLFATAGSNDSIIKSMVATSTDGTARILQIWQSPDSGTTTYLIGAVNIPANSGFGSGTTASVDLLANSVIIGLTFDQAGKPVLPLATGQKLYVGTTTAITTLTYVFVTGVQEDF